MKIYNVIVYAIVDSEDCGIRADSFTNKDKAIDKYMVEVMAAQKDAESLKWHIEEDYENHDREDTEKSYCIYDEGWYNSNHILVKLVINEVDNEPYNRCKKELCHQCAMKKLFNTDWCKECEFYED